MLYISTSKRLANISRAETSCCQSDRIHCTERTCLFQNALAPAYPNQVLLPVRAVCWAQLGEPSIWVSTDGVSQRLSGILTLENLEPFPQIWTSSSQTVSKVVSQLFERKAGHHCQLNLLRKRLATSQVVSTQICAWNCIPLFWDSNQESYPSVLGF